MTSTSSRSGRAPASGNLRSPHPCGPHGSTAAELIPKFLSISEATDLLGVSKSWLAQSRLRGDGPAYTKIGTRVVYDPRDLSVWLAGRRRTSTSQSEDRARAGESCDSKPEPTSAKTAQVAAGKASTARAAIRVSRITETDTASLSRDASIELLDTSAAAQALHVSKSWLDKSRIAGGGPPFVSVGGRRLYAIKDLNAWLDSQRRTSTSDAIPEA